MTDIIHQLDAIRQERGLSQEELAALSGLGRESISHWVVGRCRPLFPSVVDLANALGYDVVLVKRGEE